jgi:cyanate permease
MGMACLVAFLVLWGSTANSANQFVPVILAERFGVAHLGALVGLQLTVMGVASAGAPMLTGALYDAFGNYRLPIYVSAVVMGLSFLSAATVDRTGARE